MEKTINVKLTPSDLMHISAAFFDAARLAKEKYPNAKFLYNSRIKQANRFQKLAGVVE